jgi:hypothetical protein
MSPDLETLAGELADMAAATRRLNKIAAKSRQPEPRDCDCPDNGLVVRHDRASCTDPVVAELDWYAS